MTKRNTSRPRLTKSATSRRLHHESLEKRELLAAEILGANATADDQEILSAQSGPLKTAALVGDEAVTGLSLIGVNPNADELFQSNSVNLQTTSPTELTLRFSSDAPIDPSTIAGGIRILGAGSDGDIGTSDDVVIQPGWIGLSDPTNRVVTARFASALEDGSYRVEVFGSAVATAGVSALENSDGVAFSPDDPLSDRESYDFEVELGAKVSAVVPQPIVRDAAGQLTQQRDTIHVYFDDDDLFAGGGTASLRNPAFYQLIGTGGTVENTDDTRSIPATVTVVQEELQEIADPSNVGSTIMVPVKVNRVELTFSDTIDNLFGSDILRLKIGESAAVVTSGSANQIGNVTLTDPSSVVSGAVDLNALNDFSNTPSLRIEQSIIDSGLPFDYPGNPLEAGHRHIAEETHYIFEPGGSDSFSGISTRSFNFSLGQTYGQDSAGNDLFTTINEEQKQRVREVFEIYGSILGVDFVETASAGIEFVVGDLFTADPTVTSGVGGTLALGGPGGVTMDSAEPWYDGYGRSNDGPSFFGTALHEIGHALGLGHNYELPAGTVQGSETEIPASFPTEWSFPGTNDIEHGQYLFRPDNKDVDFYSITPTEDGTLAAEAFAERLQNASFLNTHLSLYEDTPSGPVLLAANDDWSGNDSRLTFDVEAGVKYFIGVTAQGNENFDPQVDDTGSGGDSQGNYELLVNFQGKAANAIVDAAETPIDGDGDGTPGGQFDFWFRSATTADTIYVDAANPVISNAGANRGSIDNPYREIGDALANAVEGNVVRIVGNSGQDGNIGFSEAAYAGPDGLVDFSADGYAGVDDTSSYEIGRNASLGITLSDGRNLTVPKGVTVMVDAGAVFKMLASRITVGSGDSGLDASGGAFQALGTPHLPVFFTSHGDPGPGLEQNPLVNTGRSGDWGGIDIRNGTDRAQGRTDYEREGIFLNYIAQADIRYGGGLVDIDGQPTPIAPIRMDASRPTIIGNRIRNNSDAALSADPASFEETIFTGLRYQADHAFVPDYDRVGPLAYGNELTVNSINGILVRIDTAAGGSKEKVLLPSRFDDTELVHVLGDSLVINGNPTGVKSGVTPNDLTQVTLQSAATGSSIVTGQYRYALSYVDSFGVETFASALTNPVLASAGDSITLTQLPAAPDGFVARRLYRSLNSSASASLRHVAELDRATATYVDSIGTPSALTPVTDAFRRAEFDARLIVDPGITIKSDSVRIETGFGADLIAEGTEGRPVIFTSRKDDRYGAGGTFDTTNNGASTGAAGDWSGINVRPTGRLSLDHAVVAFAGGSSSIDGTIVSFNPIAIAQADARIANSTFESSSPGTGVGGTFREGQGPNDASVIHVVGSQPIIVDNDFVDTASGAAIISINANAMVEVPLDDFGTQTGTIDLLDTPSGNYGPLISGNRVQGGGVSGLRVREETLTTSVVFDDTDITHVVAGQIFVPDVHVYGGLRLQSGKNESLIVKFESGGGLTADGRPLDITDRIGGSIQVIGSPGFPVILTGLRDDTVGAGLDLLGQPLLDTDGGGASVASPGSWQGIELLEFSNDRNVETIVEREGEIGGSGDVNGTPSSAQSLGLLAADEKSGDENLRLGYTVHGLIASEGDQDVYSFRGTAGTTVWLDMDRTDAALDSVIEIVDASGTTVLASSDNSTGQTTASFAGSQIIALPMQQSSFALLNDNGTYRDNYTLNPLDAGMRVELPGNAGSTQEYFVRVRGANDTSGVYQLQLRLQEQDEFAGSTVRHSEIRFAEVGILAQGQPAHSPLATDAIGSAGTVVDLGSIGSTTDGSIHLAGDLTGTNQSHHYSFEVARDSTQRGTNPYVAVTFDVDFADGLARANTTLLIYQTNGNNRTLVLVGRDSNVASDVSQVGDQTDLERGSAGALDPFIGTVELQAGSYEAVLVSNAQIAQEMDQYFVAGATNADFRLEPVSSIARIAHDQFGDTDTDPANNLSTTPQNVVFQGEDNAVPFTFGDVSLFVVGTGYNANGAETNNTSSISAHNPQIGDKEALLDGAALQRLTAFAVHPSGRLIFAQGDSTTAVENDGSVDQIYEFVNETNGGTATRDLVPLSTTGLTTFDTYTNNAGTLVVGPANTNGNTFAGTGMVFSALGYGLESGSGTDLNLYGVASRGNGVTTFARASLDGNNAVTGVNDPAVPATNYLYLMDPDTGAVQNAANGGDRGGNQRTFGAGTNRVEIARITGTGIVTGLTEVGDNMYAVNDSGELIRIAKNTIRDNSGVRLGTTRTVGAVVTTVQDAAGNDINFTGLTTGPRNLADYSDLLFGTGDDGRLHAFDVNGNLQNILGVGASEIDLDRSDIKGVGFSNLDVNLWHRSDSENNFDGHGSNATPDDIRNQQTGRNHSLYFGFETNPGNGNIQQGDWTAPNVPTEAVDGYNFPGGAQGQIESYAVDLTGYSSRDLPILYFNYLLSTEDQRSGSATNTEALDTLRVYVSSEENPTWRLVATNNNAADGDGQHDANGNLLTDNRDEFDIQESQYVDERGQYQFVQELFDANDWRQARVSLTPWAGDKDVRVRLDFASAGEPEVNALELRVRSAQSILDMPNKEFTLTNSAGDGAVRTFEFEFGAVLSMPGGAAVPDGSSVRVRNFAGVDETIVFRRDDISAAVGPNIVNYGLADSASDIAGKLRATLAALGFTVTADPENPERFSINRGTDSLFVTRTGFLSNPIVDTGHFDTGANEVVSVSIDSTPAEIRDAMQLAIANAFNPDPIGTPVPSLLPYQAFGESSLRVFGFRVTNPGSLATFGGYGYSLLPGSRAGAYKGTSAAQLRDAGMRDHDVVDANGNVNRGVYIDDVIIGFAERGEMVTGANSVAGDPQLTANPTFEARIGSSIGNFDNARRAEVSTGEYQLEVRLSAEYAAGRTTVNNRDFIFDTNTPLAEVFELRFFNEITDTPISGGDIVDGTFVQISDGVNVLKFEFEEALGNTGVQIGSIPVAYSADDTAADLAAALADAINSTSVQSYFGVFASINTGLDYGVLLNGPAAADKVGGEQFSSSNADLPLQVEKHGTPLLGYSQEILGDQNRVRAQGQLVLQNNVILDSAQYGIVTDAGRRNRSDISDATSTEIARPGPANLFVTQNEDELIPGVVIVNNIVAGGLLGGIRISGENAADASHPFARIVNNTVYGIGGGDAGILIQNQASPTLLNNAIVNAGTGLQVAGTAVAIEQFGTLYAGNGSATANINTGAFSVDGLNPANLFVDIASRNFYPAAGSLLIDSGIGALDDRFSIANVRESIGISVSPILAPFDDLSEQIRGDDPLVNSGSGTGSSVFIDRGALDRTDDIGPTAALVNPLDNDAAGVDTEPLVTYVRLADGSYREFLIRLDDVSGNGVDDATVTEDSVIVSQNGQRLIPGADYTFGYTTTNNTVVLTPTSGVWQNDASYEITLNNRQRHVIRAESGDNLVDGQQFEIQDSSGVSAVFELDSGFVLSLGLPLGIQVNSGSQDFTDREQFSITSADGSKTVTFEFDSLGGVTGNNVPIDISDRGNDITAFRDRIFAILTTGVHDFGDGRGPVSIKDELGLAPSRYQLNSIQLGIAGGGVVAESIAGIDVIGSGEGVSDGDILVYQSEGFVVQFEFDDDGVTAAATTVAIPLDRADSVLQLTQKIADAFKNADIGLDNARPIEGGRVYLGGQDGDTLDIQSATIGSTGTPGVTSSLNLTVPETATGASISGDAVVVTVGGQTETFLLTTDSSVSGVGRTIVLLTAADDANVIAASLANSIFSEFGNAPATAAENIITLNEPSLVGTSGPSVNSSVDASASVVTVSGTGGGAIPVRFIQTSEFSPDTMAGQLIAAVSRSKLSATAFTPGGGTLWLDNTTNVNGVTSVVVEPVRDLAGNNLLANRTNRETQFTILMPGVNFDFGDAPSRTNSVSDYLTLLVENGARHTLLAPSFPRLGSEVDFEIDAAAAGTAGISDDSVSQISGVGTGVFDVATPGVLSSNLDIDFGTVAPSQGDLLTLSIDSDLDGTIDITRVFEIVLAGGTPASGNLGILSVPGESPALLAARATAIIQQDLNASAPRFSVELDTITDQLRLASVDDEDGVYITSTTYAGNQIDGVFVDLSGNVSGFLNPLATEGTEIIVETTGGGLLDAWVDFNTDGDFDDPGEKVLTNEAVLDGINTVRVFTPDSAGQLNGVAAAGFGSTWARFRISSTGNLLSDGIAIGGEVEDYEVFVAKIELPEAIDDVYPDTVGGYQAFEDTQLIVDAAGAVSVNDILKGGASTLTNVRYEVVQTPKNVGNLGNPAEWLFNETDGSFVYQSKTDFYGEDFFTYRIVGDVVIGGKTYPISSSVDATVTIAVAPINDPPVAVDHPEFVVTESSDTNPNSAITISNTQLLSGAIPHALVATTLTPFNEAEQSLSVSQIWVRDAAGAFAAVADATDAATPTDGVYTLETYVEQQDGLGVSSWVVQGAVSVTVAGAEVTSFTFTPADDYNEDNVRFNAATPSEVEIRYTVADDGATTLPNGDPANPQPAPNTSTATFSIVVKPQNDLPTAVNDSYTDANAALGAPVEDTDFVIGRADILGNDYAGRSDDDDESLGIDGNDVAVRLVTAAAVGVPAEFQAFPLTTVNGGTVSIDGAGDLVYRAAEDYYGPDEFAYVIYDEGIDEDVAGNQTSSSKYAVATVSLTVQSVNDVPASTNKDFVTLEDTTIRVTAAELVAGGVGHASPALGAPWDESNQNTTMQVRSLNVNGVNVDAGNAVGGMFSTAYGGTVTAVFLGTGFLDYLEFTPALSFNADNPLTAGARTIETFTYTMEDDAVAELPVGTPFSIDTPQTSTSYINILVTPQNDAIVIADDVISTKTAGWDAFLTGLATPLGLDYPTEGMDFVIPTAYLFGNDANGPAEALDETGNVNSGGFALPNDNDLQYINLPYTTALGGMVTLRPDGDLLYTPPNGDVYGKDSFVYEVTDAGVNEAVDGTRTLAARTASATVSLLLRAVNDTPVAEDRGFRAIESVEYDDHGNPTANSTLLSFTAEDLLQLGPAATNPAVVPGVFDADLARFTAAEQSIFREEEHLLVVSRFAIPGAADFDIDNVDAAVDTDPSFFDAVTGDATGSGTITRTTANGGTLNLTFNSFAFVSGSYAPAVDYNERLPFVPTDDFSYTVADRGTPSTTPGIADFGTEILSDTDLADSFSVPATIALSITQVNDPPVFVMPATLDVVEDVYSDVAGGRHVVAGFANGIFAGISPTARDENDNSVSGQSVTFSLAAIGDVPAGLMSQVPEIAPNGDLTLFPVADAYGVAVFEVTASDNDPVDPLVTIQTLTVTVFPVNDQPVAQPRAFTVDEVVELDEQGVATGNQAVLTITAEDLLQLDAAATNPAVLPGSFDAALGAPHDESEHVLEVVRFTVPGADPFDIDNVDAAIDTDPAFFDAGTGDATGTGTMTRTTPNGGLLTLSFVDFAFTSGTYAPAVDYNERLPFSPTDPFSYGIVDRGTPSTVPGIANLGVAGLPGSDDLPDVYSAEATITLNVTETNDPPVFVLPPTLDLVEDVYSDTATSTHVIPNFVTGIFNGPSATALDEIDNAVSGQSVSFTFNPIGTIPNGLMRQTPTLSPSGELTLFPVADAFGVAVYEIIANDNDPTDPLQSIQTLTVTVFPVNDQPVAEDRGFTVDEVVELDEQGAPTGAQAILTITAEDLLQRSVGASNPAVLPGVFDASLGAPYDEQEHQIDVVRFEVPGAAPFDVDNVDPLVDTDPAFFDVGTGAATGTGTITRTTVTGATLTLTFIDFAFVSGTYAPSVDYNERTPFDPTDPFTYAVADRGTPTTVPGVNNLPGGLAGSFDLADAYSVPATVTINVTETNDPPLFDLADNNVIIGEDTSTDPATGEFVISSFVSQIFPGDPTTALDEAAPVQTVTFQVRPIAPFVPFLMLQNPVVSEASGDLTLFPRPDAYGVQRYEVVATDTDPLDPKQTIQTLTITIAPENDVPVTYNRFLSVDEAVEVNRDGTDSGLVAVLDFDASDLLSGNGGLTATAHERARFLPSTFDENEQNLVVKRFSFPNSVSTPAVDIDNIDPALDAGITAGTGSLTRRTASGLLTLNFVNFAFTTGSYTPDVDYNSRSPFSAPDLFAYRVTDDGVVTVPGSGAAAITQPVRESAEAAVFLTVNQFNDTPIFAFRDGVNTLTIQEDAVGGTATYLDRGFIVGIAPSAPTALDERLPAATGQDVSFTVRAVSVPAGLMQPIDSSNPMLGMKLPTVSPTTGDLQLFPAADAYGYAVYEIIAADSDPTDPRELVQTLTITILPENDRPTAYPRSLTLTEAVEFDNDPAAIVTFNSASLIEGDSANGEVPNTGGDFAASLVAPHDESEQAPSLTIVGFRVPGAADIDPTDIREFVGGTGTATRQTVNGGTLEFSFVNGVFVDGSYAPAIDYNQETPFLAVDQFSYITLDDGQTTVPGAAAVAGAAANVVLGAKESLPGTVSISVIASNDQMQFNYESTVNVLERDDNGREIFSDWATNVSPASAAALDEIARQDVVFSYIEVPGVTDIPAGLFRLQPTISNVSRALEIYPNPDAIGQAVIVIRAAEQLKVAGSDPSFVARTQDVTVTINVQPVNDAPAIDVPTTVSASGGPDAGYTISSNGVITYTLPEDNTSPTGQVTGEFLIPLTQGTAAGYNPIGILDVFKVGPDNESQNFPGGNQFLELVDQFPITTDQGGTVSLIDVSGVPTLSYLPPANYNTLLGPLDGFSYAVIDDSSVADPSLGETYVKETDSLVSDRLTSTNRVQFRLNPVNDAPEFDLISPAAVEVGEDGGQFSLDGFALSIAAGPTPTAIDEIVNGAGQTVMFTTPRLVGGNAADVASLFVNPPAISAAGRLTFRPAPDVFGVFQFEVELTDSGVAASNRGDANTSPTQTFTINVLPKNDPPAFSPTTPSLSYMLNEDETKDLPLTGIGPDRGLFDDFVVGPNNEAAPILPQLGGDQSISFFDPIPTLTVAGGSLTPITDANGLTHLRYTPRAGFSGTDSFVFTVKDSGTSVNPGTGGAEVQDSLTASTTVFLSVNSVNDAPVFDPVSDVNSDEDAGVVTIQNWARNVFAGPIGSADEITGPTAQALDFQFTFISGDAGLLTADPTATVVGSTASLSYTSVADASGSSVWSVRLHDDGPTAGALDNPFSQTQTFTLTVDSVNDAPTFIAGPLVAVNEDSGPATVQWATQISPGPADESGQSVQFEVTVPAGQTDLFAPGATPTIDAGGVLAFTPAANASGAVDLLIHAVDFLADGTRGVQSPPVTLRLVIDELSDPPVANDDSFATTEDAILTINDTALLANDVDPDSATNSASQLAVQLSPTFLSVLGATVTFDSATGQTIYDPSTSSTIQNLAPNGSIVDTFEYSIIDVSDLIPVSSTAVVSITVSGENDAPNVQDDDALLNPVGGTTISVLANDSDIDGTLDPTSIIITQQPVNGSLTLMDDGTIVYSRFASFNGSDTFTYTVADNRGQQSEKATVTVFSAPSSVTGMAGTSVGRVTQIDVLEFVSTVDSPVDPGSIIIVTPPEHGQAVANADGTVSYTPDTGYVGTDSFQYRIADVNGHYGPVSTVDLNVVASAMENPTQPMDVNADSFVTVLDALLIINHLSRQGTGVSSIAVDPTSVGPNYLDPNGDLFISVRDALGVINQIGRTNSGLEPEGESVAGVRYETINNEPTTTTVSEETSQFETTDKLVGELEIDSIASDVVDLVAAESRDDDAPTDETSAEAFDEVFKDLI